MSYIRCFENDRDKREERRDACGSFNGTYDNNYNYNHMIVAAARYNAKKDSSVVKKRKRGTYTIVFK